MHDIKAASTDRLSGELAAAIEAMGLAPRRLSSGASHDAMAFDKIIPFAMPFVRCRGGVSHNPAEFAAPEDIDIAARVPASFLDRMSTP
jgi:allantoate deiminase